MMKTDTCITAGQGLLRVVDLGRLAYAPALTEQRRVHRSVVEGALPPTLLLVEHDPVITVTHRPAAAQHLLAPAERLAQLGIDVQETDRGGDVTYHGPGQLVAYPILPLNPLGLNVGRYMRLLEQAAIDTLAEFGVRGRRVEGATGVWVDDGIDAKPQASAKIAAIGVRVARGVTMHGLALNVTTDLSHFETIVPCGLANRNVTSLAELLGERCPEMEQVKSRLTEQLDRTIRDVARPCH